MPRIEIDPKREDSEVRCRQLNVRVGTKTAATPRRSLCLTSDPHSEAHALSSNRSITSINELPREIDKDILDEIDGDQDQLEAFGRNIRYRFAGIDTATDITVFILTYSNSGQHQANRQPTEVEVEYLCGLLDHPYNDIWVPPRVPGLSGRAYIEYLKEFYEQVDSNRKVAYAGLIPHIMRLEIRLLTRLYQDHGVNYFIVDFDGRHPLDLYLNVREIVQMIDTIEKETGSTCFLHAINVPMTKARWATQVVPAKDIPVFAMGFNCFGSSHIRRTLPPEVAEKLKSKSKRPFRVFNRYDYGYYRSDTPGLKSMVAETEPTVISLTDFTNGLTGTEVNSLEKLLNVERHGLEAKELRRRLVDKESIGEYIRTKKQMPEIYQRKIFKLKNPVI